MEKASEQKHFLALQALPGDNAYIDIAKLNISNGYTPTNLAEIDSFTMAFTYEQILSSIKESNIVSSKYLAGKLVIVDNQKHNPIEVITQDLYNNFDLINFLTDNINNKNVLNTICNKYGAIVNDIPLTKVFKNSSVIEMANMIFKLPYLDQRKMILYIIEKNNSSLIDKNKINELVRDKAA